MLAVIPWPLKARQTSVSEPRKEDDYDIAKRLPEVAEILSSSEPTDQSQRDSEEVLGLLKAIPPAGGSKDDPFPVEEAQTRRALDAIQRVGIQTL